MVEYKIEARDNILIRSLGVRLGSGDTINVEDPSDSVMDELERFYGIGDIRLEELEEQVVTTVEEPEEESEVSDEIDELIGSDVQFECTICDRSHYGDSKIGQKHLEQMLEENDLEEIEFLKE